MTYAESVEEGLCFGWIDGLTRRIDDEVYTIRFTPRRRTSNWSAINIAKIAELTEAGRMHPAGSVPSRSVTAARTRANASGNAIAA